MIESEGGYGLYSSKSGIILNLSYNQIQTLYDEKGNIYFKAIHDPRYCLALLDDSI